MAINIGRRGLTTFSIFVPATLHPINSTEPTGGVQSPKLRFNTIIIPKWMGSIPIAVTIGKKMGVKIKIAGVISINIPTTSKIILMIKSMMIGLLLMLRSVEDIVWGIFSYAIIHESPVQVAIRSNTTAVVLAVESNTDVMSPIFISPYTNARARE